MGTYTKIIEFYGLPGCGKTTLCRRLKDLYVDKGFRVGLLPDAVTDFRWKYLFLKLSFREIILYTRFIHKLKKYRVHKNLVLSVIRRFLIYKSARVHSKYDYVFIDHGVVQSIVRALYDTPCPIDLLRTTVFREMLSATFVEGIIHCDISSKEAYNRVRIRNRKNSGTFDQFSDEALKMVLDGHVPIFESIESILIEFNKNIFTIDCNCEIERCVSQVEQYMLNE